MPADWDGLADKVRKTRRRLWILAARLLVLFTCDFVLVWRGIHYANAVIFVLGVGFTWYSLVIAFEAYDLYLSLQELQKEIARYVRR